MDQATAEIEDLITLLGGTERASRLADRLLIVWHAQRRSSFGTVEPLISARAAANLISRGKLSIREASVDWLSSKARNCLRDDFFHVAETCLLLEPKEIKGSGSDIRGRLAGIWSEWSRREPDVERGERYGRFFDLIDTDQCIEAAAELAARHPGLSGRSLEIKTYLKLCAHSIELMEQLAGEPTWLIEPSDLFDIEAKQVRIASEAIAEIWKCPMLTSGGAAEALGAKKTNREKVRALREDSELLGLPRRNRFLYPAFQFDPERRAIRPVVAQVNRVLAAAEDPWGVASWWVSPNAWLQESARPADVLGTKREGEVLHASYASVDPDGEAAVEERPG